MKHLILLIGLLFITSCNGQTDLEQIKIDEKISFDTSKLEKDSDPTYGLKGYSTADLSHFKIANIPLNTYKLPDGYEVDYSDLYVFVDNYENNKFLGYMINSVKEDEQKKLIEFLTKKYGKPQFSSKKEVSKSMIWVDNTEKKWILLSQNTIGLTRKHIPFKELQLIVVKQGTRVENSKDEKVFTIIDSYKLSHFQK